MPKTTITAEPGSPQITIVRDFHAPRDLVFRAYTEPDLLVQWLGPRELTMTVTGCVTPPTASASC